MESEESNESLDSHESEQEDAIGINDDIKTTKAKDSDDEREASDDDTDADGNDSDTNDDSEQDDDDDDPILDLAAESENEKAFREQVANIMMYYKLLKKSDTYKELYETIGHYEEKGYGLDEAVYAAVRKRKYLLNRIFNEQQDQQPETDEDMELH